MIYTVAKTHVPDVDETLRLNRGSGDDIDWQPLQGPEQLLAVIEE